MGQLEDMSVFVRIVDAGSISKAAEQLGIAKSGVSRRLVALETRLGMSLINRTTRSSSLTSLGREYYERAVKLIGDVAEMDALTTDEEKSLEGLLRLAVPLSFGLCHLSPAIDKFVSIHPELSINIDFSDRQVDLVEQGVDLAIRISDLNDSSLKARRICPIHVVLCASPAYLEKYGAPQKAEDLKDHQVLGYTLRKTNTIKISDAKGEEHLIQTSAKLAANNGDFLQEMALASHGIVALPTFIVWKSLAAGELVTILDSYSPPTLHAWAVYPQTRYLSQRARQFIDFLVGQFGETPYWDQV